MIEINDKSLCCGCNACGDICAKGAISFRTDNEGFWYPVVDADKCVGCGLCEKVCPVINIESLKKNDLPKSICYAAEHKNLEVVFDSTSGGLFTALAEAMYKQGGYVGGAVYSEDFKSVHHFISNDRKDLISLRSSKYLQSNAEGFYKRIKELVKTGEKVLVCGTPCQMAALRAYLGKDYDNLMIVDFVCRGINSPKVWGKYIDSFQERYGSKVVSAKSKSKEYGWRNLTFKAVLADGRAIYETKDHNDFTKGYLKTGAFCRPSCYECQFKGYPRMSDITLADFWGVEKVKQSMDKDLGTSLVMLNSQKGKTFFQSVLSRINCTEVSLSVAEAENKALTSSLPYPKVERDAFFADLDVLSFSSVVRKYDKSFQGNVSFKQKLKEVLVFWHRVARTTQGNMKSVCQFFRYNTFKEIRERDVLIFAPYCIVDIGKNAKIEKQGISVLGEKTRFKKSKMETRLCVEDGGVMRLGPGTILGYGSDVEVFKGALLDFKGHGGSNMGSTIICGEHIEFGEGVIMGRNVTIRDNNGSHYINRLGYKNSSPVIIGCKVWLCEQCVLMSGVKIGDGAIVGAKSFVVKNVPAHTLVSGHPAEVIDEDMLWKY